MKPIITLSNVTKEYNSSNEKVLANDDISVTINSERITGIFGSNGSGKTTLIRQIVGVTTPTKGSIFFEGDCVKNMKDNVSYMSQSSYSSYWGLKVSECVFITCKLHDMKHEDISEKYEKMKDYFGLKDIDKKMFGSLSGGMRRIVCFIISYILPKKIYIFDEPSNDIDPYKRKLMWDKVNELKLQKKTVILVTHNISEIESMIDDIIIMSKGKIIQSNQLDSILQNNLYDFKYSFLSKSSSDDLIEQLHKIGKVNFDDQCLFNVMINGESVVQIEQLLSTHDIESYDKRRVSLENICFDLIREEYHDDQN